MRCLSYLPVCPLSYNFLEFVYIFYTINFLQHFDLIKIMLIDTVVLLITLVVKIGGNGRISRPLVISRCCVRVVFRRTQIYLRSLY